VSRPVIAWFRRNLRLTDNPALLAACETTSTFTYDQCDLRLTLEPVEVIVYRAVDLERIPLDPSGDEPA